MINELRHVFSEDELSTPRDKNGSQLGSSLESNQSSSDKLRLSTQDNDAIRDNYIKEYQKMDLALKNAIKELRNSSTKNDWSREISDLAEQNHKLNNEVRMCQETIDRIHVLYKESEQKVREFIRSTMRQIMSRAKENSEQQKRQRNFNYTFGSDTIDL